MVAFQKGTVYFVLHTNKQYVFFRSHFANLAINAQKAGQTQKAIEYFEGAFRAEKQAAMTSSTRLLQLVFKGNRNGRQKGLILNEEVIMVLLTF